MKDSCVRVDGNLTDCSPSRKGQTRLCSSHLLYVMDGLVKQLNMMEVSIRITEREEMKCVYVILQELLE